MAGCCVNRRVADYGTAIAGSGPRRRRPPAPGFVGESRGPAIAAAGPRRPAGGVLRKPLRRRLWNGPRREDRRLSIRVVLGNREGSVTGPEG